MQATFYPFPRCLMQTCVCVCVCVSVWPRLNPRRLLCLHSIPNTLSNSFPLLVHLFSSLYRRKSTALGPAHPPTTTTFLHPLFTQCNFKLKVIEQDWNIFIWARKASECILWLQSNSCTLVCTRYSIRLHVLQKTAIRQTAEKVNILPSCFLLVDCWLKETSQAL